MLYAQDHWALLLVFQAMDAAGKDGTIKHLTSGINSQGCHVTSYKQPSSEELDHDFLWRYMRNVPARGMIGIFNRSYYEELLVVKVHPELLARQKLHPSLITKSIWDDRYEDIGNYERYLHRNGVRVVKFFLHVSHAEQKRRFMERLDQPEKNWKFSASDVAERQHWSDYQEAYEEAIKNTASKHAPWYVVPADNKWFTRLIVAGAVVDAMAELEARVPRGRRRQAQSARSGSARASRTSERRRAAQHPDATGTPDVARAKILDWLFDYRKDWLRPDIIAGLITAAVVIPKAMAYATVAGLPVQAGLYTAFVPAVIYALLGSSRVLSVSTTTTIAILTGANLALVVPDGDPAALLTRVRHVGGDGRRPARARLRLARSAFSPPSSRSPCCPASRPASAS